MVMVALPSLAVAAALRRIETVPAPGAAMELLERAAVTPWGNPEIEMATADWNPPAHFVVSAGEALAPRLMERLLGLVEAEREGRFRVN
jgi:hypothetical protein